MLVSSFFLEYLLNILKETRESFEAPICLRILNTNAFGFDNVRQIGVIKHYRTGLLNFFWHNFGNA